MTSTVPKPIELHPKVRTLENFQESFNEVASSQNTWVPKFKHWILWSPRTIGVWARRVTVTRGSEADLNIEIIDTGNNLIALQSSL